jgi:ATP-binding cassette subfamily F protein uup
MQAQRSLAAPSEKPPAKSPPKPEPASAAKPAGKAAKPGLSFSERKRLADLPAIIARLEAELAKLADLLSDADLYTRDPVKFRKATEMAAERQAALEAAEEEWLILAERDS